MVYFISIHSHPPSPTPHPPSPIPPSCLRPMTVEEKRELGAHLGLLPAQNLERVIAIIHDGEQTVKQTETEVEIDIDRQVGGGSITGSVCVACVFMYGWMDGWMDAWMDVWIFGI